VRAVGVTRSGATRTASMLDECRPPVGIACAGAHQRELRRRAGSGGGAARAGHARPLRRERHHRCERCAHLAAVGRLQAADLADDQTVVQGEELHTHHACHFQAGGRGLDFGVKRPRRIAQIRDHRQHSVAMAVERRPAEHQGGRLTAAGESVKGKGTTTTSKTSQVIEILVIVRRIPFGAACAKLREARADRAAALCASLRYSGNLVGQVIPGATSSLSRLFWEV